MAGMQISSASAAPQPTIVSRVSSPARAFKTALGLSVLLTAASVLSYPFLQPVIPVFYTLSQPERQLAHKIWIFLFPVLAWVVTLLHFSLLKTMKNVEGNMLHIFSWATVGVLAVTALLFVRVILIVL